MAEPNPERSWALQAKFSSLWKLAEIFLHETNVSDPVYQLGCVTKLIDGRHLEIYTSAIRFDISSMSPFWHAHNKSSAILNFSPFWGETILRNPAAPELRACPSADFVACVTQRESGLKVGHRPIVFGSICGSRARHRSLAAILPEKIGR